MKNGKALYFSSAEFAIMLELAGEARCSLLRFGKPPSREMLTMSFVSLFQRKLIQRSEDGLVVAGEGELFRHIRKAPVAVVIGVDSFGEKAICYVEEDTLWMVELTDAVVAWQYRVCALCREDLPKWLIESGFLERPVLTDADIPELKELFADELEDGRGLVLCHMERHLNGGAVLCRYELRRGRSGRLLFRSSRNEETTEIYTVESLSRMLTECFGKGLYDYC